MYQKKKERLYIRELLEDPAMGYPAYYLLSASMLRNEMLQETIVSLHSCDFASYGTPKDFDEIFTRFGSGSFAIYNEQYIVGYFGGKMMYLEPSGWRAMPATEALFDLKNWLLPV